VKRSLPRSRRAATFLTTATLSAPAGPDPLCNRGKWGHEQKDLNLCPWHGFADAVEVRGRFEDGREEQPLDSQPPVDVPEARERTGARLPTCGVVGAARVEKRELVVDQDAGDPCVP
jgi:hypothetical protein